MHNGLLHKCMSLPFMRRRQESGLSGITVKYRSPDDKTPQESDKDDSALESAAADLLRAIQQNDVKQIALAWKAGFEILDSMPHNEGPHTNEGQE
jgi:hypothetical protein